MHLVPRENLPEPNSQGISEYLFIYNNNLNILKCMNFFAKKIKRKGIKFKKQLRFIFYVRFSVNRIP